MQKKKAFSLPELLVVMIIISVLGTIGVISYNGAKLKSRDAKRSSDLSIIVSALELYKADNKAYPTLPLGGPAGCTTKVCDGATGSSTADAYESNWKSLQTLMANYLYPLPQDPLVGQTSKYRATSGINYGYYYLPTDGSAFDPDRSGCTVKTCHAVYAIQTETSQDHKDCELDEGKANWGDTYLCVMN